MTATIQKWGNSLASIPSPRLLDSSDADGSGGALYTAAARWQVARSNDQTTLTLIVQRQNLDEAVYPAYVDISLSGFGATPAPAPAAAPAAPAADVAAPAAARKGDVAMPAAAKLLAEKGLAASAVAGTGKDGRVTKGDVLAAAPAPSAAAAPRAAPTPQALAAVAAALLD